jgi:AcrR family transcriptional regulator
MIGEIENLKQQEITKTAHQLFWKYGVKRVSVEEICREAGVSKMTFYKFYSNKIELAKAILGDLMNLSMKRFEEIVKSDISFSQKLEAIFMMKIEAINNFSKEFMKDLYSNPDLGLKDFLEERAQFFSESVKKFYIEAQHQGNIRSNVNIDFVMAYSSHIAKLMENEQLMALYDTPADFILEVMNLLFYGITTRTK